MHRSRRLASSISFLLLSAWLALAPGAGGAQDSQEGQGGQGGQGGQQGQGGLFFDTVDVDLINVEVFVTDRKGNAVTGLKPEDFLVTVDNQPVTISNFYSEVLGRPVRDDSGQPLEGMEHESFDAAPLEQRLHLFIFVDNANIRPSNRKRVFRSLREFLDNNLQRDDLVSIASIKQSVFVHNDFTTDRRVQQQVLDDIEKIAGRSMGLEFDRRQIYSELSREELTEAARGEEVETLRIVETDINAAQLLSRIRAYAADGYDQARGSLKALGAYVDSLSGVPGRKALLHVSDGIPTRPGEDLYLAWHSRFIGSTSDGAFDQDIGNYDLFPQFLELSQRANAARVTFYALDAEANHSAFVRSAETEGVTPQISVSLRGSNAIDANYREPLEMAALDTGGRRIYASSTLDQQLTAVSTDFSTFYSLGFPAVDGAKDKNRQIEVKLVPDKRKGLRVRHRSSYNRKPQEQRTAEATVAALLYNAVANPLGVELKAGAGVKRDDGRTVLPVEVEIPVANLTLLPTQGVHAAQLSFFVTVKDGVGNARPVQKIPFSLRIPDQFVEQAKGDRARHTLPVVLADGDQQIAISVRDDIGATSSTLRLELPGGARRR
jgi:VWFA-related protein